MDTYTQPQTILRVEGATIFMATLLGYAFLGGSWIWFILFLFAPDLSMLGYLANPRLGAVVYNIFHIYFWPLGLMAGGWLAAMPISIQAGLIWMAHISLDRMMGFGLKYSDRFKHTHLGEM
ncbi:MAG: DUF4260 domain-containing protein [Lentisphaeria bacterium]|nr:DUF4260 domain-containing protein [Candidatus Neomarinimicrobiota bacterium]MCF7843135.1 DUF4260 domain-containing protein [Lentisphaeria bacterium]